MAKNSVTVTITVNTKYKIAQLLRIIDPQTDPELFDTLLIAWHEACRREKQRRRNARKRSVA
jgi:mitochondrial fission protein ELM1